MRSLKAAGIVLALVLGACGSKDSVSLSASVSNVDLTVTQQTLGTQLSGSFQLYLEVGPEADGAATVSLDSFSILRASDHASLVSPLQAVPQGVSFPLTVGKGENKTVTFSIDDSKLLPASAKTDLCAGQVEIVGTVKHNLNGGETKPLQSKATTISGC